LPTAETLLSTLPAFGGLGLFLLGMIIMTDGLHALAGNAMRSALMRFTHSPTSGVLTGAASTAILQSSSATTVAAIGFVGTGLIQFPEALGIVFGANIGTTVTGWLVALLGFKLNLGAVMLPLVLLGAILRLFASGRLAHTGYTIAGFGLIFVGIAMMQQGMAGFSDLISFDGLPADSVFGLLKLVAIGIIFTFITQSSSAGVATVLTALFSDLIIFQQAAALVIGMNIGTTLTAVLATLGGSVEARRTGYSHVIYNLFTGFGALFLITPYIWVWQAISAGTIENNAEIALVAFHTTFNILGVIIALPLTNRFVQLIERLVPEKETSFTAGLGHALLSQPSLALTAVQQGVLDEFIALLAHARAILSDDDVGQRAELPELREALDKTRAYIDRIHLSPRDQSDWERLVALIHTLDHIQRLFERFEEEEDRALTASTSKPLSEVSQLLIHTIDEMLKHLTAEEWQAAARCAEETHYEITQQEEPLRKIIMDRIASGEVDVHVSTSQLEAVRWLQRVSKHLSRISYRYSQALLATAK
jgi:phosphate:Na+ symporter